MMNRMMMDASMPGPEFLLQNLGGVVLGIHFVYDSLDNPFCVDDECLAECPDAYFAAHLLLSPRSECLEHLG